MSLVEHARRELDLCGQTAEDPAYAQSIIAAVAAFASYGHSGGSAMCAAGQLDALIRYKPLSPLTAAPDEWMDRSVESGYPMWQNVRDSSAFSKDGGVTHYLLDDPDTIITTGSQRWDNSRMVAVPKGHTLVLLTDAEAKARADFIAQCYAITSEPMGSATSVRLGNARFTQARAAVTKAILDAISETGDPEVAEFAMARITEARISPHPVEPTDVTTPEA